MKKTSPRLSILALVFLSLFSVASAEADASGGFKKLSDIINAFTGSVVKALGGLFMAAAVVAFFYGVVQYIWSIREGKEAGVTAGKTFMIWSLVGLFAMFSVYGIVTWGQDIFGIKETSKSIIIPEIILFNKGGASTPNTTVDPLTPSTPDTPVGRGVGASCGRDTRCNAGLTCVDSVCEDTSCGRDRRCSTGFTCTNYRCVRTPSGSVVYTPDDGSVNTDASEAVLGGGAGGSVTSNCDNAAKGDVCNGGNGLSGTCQDTGSKTLECTTD